MSRLPASSRRSPKGPRASTVSGPSRVTEEDIQTSPDLETMRNITWKGVYDLTCLSKSLTLPLLVRALESHYDNSDLSTFSKLDVLKIHKGVVVDLVLAKFERTGKARHNSGQKDDHGLTVDMVDDRPVQICFPKDFCGLFQLSSAGEKKKTYKGAKSLLEHMPRVVRVTGRGKEFPADIRKDDLIQILGEITDGDTTYLSIKRNKVGAEPSKMSMKCKGSFETVTDSKTYSLSEILQLFTLPIVVNLPKKSKHAVNVKSEVLSLLNHVGGTLTLQREVASEFFVASTTVQQTPEQTTILVLSKNANVQFQVADDQGGEDYNRVLESFGSVALKGIPQELFISEHGMPFVACLNYRKHAAQIKKPEIASQDIPPAPPPRPISTRQQLPIPGYGKIKSKLGKHATKIQDRSQERQDSNSEGSDESPLYDRINDNALRQTRRVERGLSPHRQASDNDYFAQVRHKDLFVQGAGQFNTSPVSVRRNKTIASPCDVQGQIEHELSDRRSRTSRIGRSSSDTQAKYGRNNGEPLMRRDELNPPIHTQTRHHSVAQVWGDQLNHPTHIQTRAQIQDELRPSNATQTRFHEVPHIRRDEHHPLPAVPNENVTKHQIVERNNTLPTLPNCGTTNPSAMHDTYPNANMSNPIPSVQITSCQEEDPYMNMTKSATRNFNKDFLHPAHPSSTKLSRFSNKATGSLPRDGRIVSQVMHQGHRQSSNYFVPSLQQLQHHRLEPPAAGADGYIRMERGGHVTFEEQSTTQRLCVSEGNYINCPNHRLATMKREGRRSRERSKSLESILCLEPPNQADPPTLPPRPAASKANFPPPSRVIVDHPFIHCTQQDTVTRQHSPNLGGSAENWFPKSQGNHEHNLDRDYQRNLPIRAFRNIQQGVTSNYMKPEDKDRTVSLVSGYATVPRHPKKHRKSSTVPEISISNLSGKKIPPPVPRRSSESNYLRAPDKSPQRSVERYSQDMEKDNSEDTVTHNATIQTLFPAQQVITRDLPSMPPHQSPQPCDPSLTVPDYAQDDDEDIYDDLAPPFKISNEDLSSKMPVQGIQDDADGFPPPPSTEELQRMFACSPAPETPNAPAAITRKREIPRDIGKLSVTDLGHCLRLLNVDNHIIDNLHQQQVDGTLLKHMTEDMISSLGVSGFQAKKLYLFAHDGWRPTSSCDMDTLKHNF